MTDLSAEILMACVEALAAREAAEDADVFVRFGEDGYAVHRAIKHGGMIIVGGDDDVPGSLGPNIVAELRRVSPWFHIHMTRFLPDGDIYVLASDALGLSEG